MQALVSRAPSVHDRSTLHVSPQPAVSFLKLTAQCDFQGLTTRLSAAGVMRRFPVASPVVTLLTEVTDDLAIIGQTNQAKP
jgi:hypothetical protein